MAVIEGGTSAVIAEVGAATTRAIHTRASPIDWSTLGHYRAIFNTGTMAAGVAADAEILQFRWTDATRLAVIQKVWIANLNSLTAFAAGFGRVRLTVARGFTVAGSGGGAATLTGDNNAMRTSMGTSIVGEVRVATTAALGAGTKTLDANDMGICRFQIDTTANKILLGTAGATATGGSTYTPTELFEANMADGEHPIVLAQNEGIAIRATVPATGTWECYMGIQWAEVTAF